MKLMNKILLTSILGSSLLMGQDTTGDVGSKMESMQWKMKLQLVKEDNTKVTILDGTKYLEMKSGKLGSAFGAALSGTKPSAGTYKGLHIERYGIKQKGKIVVGAETYYTVDGLVAEGNSYNLTTDESQYGTLEKDTTGFNQDITFTKLLVITDDAPVTLVHINKMFGNIKAEHDGNILNTTSLGENAKFDLFLPEIPAKTIRFDVTYSHNSDNNKTTPITIFLDSTKILLGAISERDAFRDSNTIAKALDSVTLLEGNLTSSMYNFKFAHKMDSEDGIIGDDYDNVKVTINCTNSTFTSLTADTYIDNVKQTKDSTYSVDSNQGNFDGYNLNTTGSVVCKDLNLE